MTRAGWIAWHRWIGLLLGGLAGIWTIGGLVLTSHDPAPQGAVLAPRTLQIAPAEAIALARTPADTGAVTSLRTVEIAGRLTYRIGWRNRPAVLVDGATGHLVVIDSAQAVVIARHQWPTALVRNFEVLRTHTAFHSSGPLPVWRVTLADPSVRVLVRPDGSTRLVRSRGGWREWMVDMHTLLPVRALPGGLRGYGPLLWLSGLGAFAIGITGYVISFWPRRRRVSRGRA